MFRRLISALVALTLLSSQAVASSYTAVGSGAPTATPNPLTINNGGAGAASGATFDGSSAVTISTNTLGALKVSSNLSDLGSASTARANLGLGTAATQATSAFLQPSNNLSDLASINATAKNLGIGYSLLQTGAAVAHTGDTAEFTLASTTLPGNALGANGIIRATIALTFTGTAGSKLIRIKLGSTVVGQVTASSTFTALRVDFLVTNANATGAQVGSGFGLSSVGNAIGDARSTSVDTTADQTLSITTSNTSGADTATLVSGQILIFPHN